MRPRPPRGYPTRDRLVAVAGGAVAALAFVGFAVLTDGLRAAAPGVPPSASPTDVADTLPWPGLHSSAGTGTVIAALLAVLGAGAVSGAVGRRHLLRGLVVLLALDAVLAVLWSVGHAAGWLAATVATTASLVTYLAVLRGGTPRQPGVHRAATASTGSRATPRSVLPRVVLSRREALAAGALVAVAAGVGGLLVRSSTGSRSTAARTSQRGVVPAPEAEPLLIGQVFDVRGFGATGDGVGDDGDAVRRALAAANAAGGTLFFPAGTYLYRAASPLQPAERVTVSGVPGQSTIKYEIDGSAYAEFFSVTADGVTVDGLTVERIGGAPAVLIGLGPITGFTLSRVRLIGNQGQFPDTYCHGVKLSDTGAAGRIRLVDSHVTGMQYGLLQTNASTAVVTELEVERCSFEKNQNTDLEFNSPHGLIRQILVRDCHFSDNDSPGFAVGLAHVQNAEIRSNSFDSYALEAVHIEDYSENVTVTDNDFVDCGLRDHSFVQVISGSRTVSVTANTFHARRNTKPIYMVNALPGGTDPTAGGRPPGPPSDVVVRDNRFECVASVVPAYFQGIRGGVISSNTIDGFALGSPGDAFRLLDDQGTAVSRNTINGTLYEGGP